MDNQRIRIPLLQGYAVDHEGNLWRVNAKSRSSPTLRGIIYDKPYDRPRTLAEIAKDLGKRHSLRGMTPCSVMSGLWQMDAPNQEIAHAGWRGTFVDYFRGLVPCHATTPWFIVDHHKRPMSDRLRVYLETHGGLSRDMRKHLPCIVAGHLLFNALSA